jgi:hypothetical protein
VKLFDFGEAHAWLVRIAALQHVGVYPSAVRPELFGGFMSASGGYAKQTP